VARNVYTTEFLAVPYGSAGFFVAGPVPVGVVWDVRDVFAISGAYPWQSDGQIQVTDNAGSVIAWWGPADVNGDRPLHWEGRQLLLEGDQLNCNITGSGSSLRITGYTLTLP